mgnify:CR=1 FL=1
MPHRLGRTCLIVIALALASGGPHPSAQAPPPFDMATGDFNRDGIPDLDGLGRDQNALSGWLQGLTGGAGVLVEKDHDRHEGEDGQQHSDQDDEAIRSLHERSPCELGWVKSMR